MRENFKIMGLRRSYAALREHGFHELLDGLLCVKRDSIKVSMTLKGELSLGDVQVALRFVHPFCHDGSA